MECLVNILAIMLFGVNIFYYIPSDLLHITTLAILPFYILIGFLGLHLMHAVKKQRQAMPISFLLLLVSAIFIILGR